MDSALRVAILEEHRLLRELTARVLREEGFGVEAASTPEELFSLLDASPFQAALVLMHPQPHGSALEEGARRLLCELKGFWSQVRVVLVLSGGTEALAA